MEQRPDKDGWIRPKDPFDLSSCLSAARASGSSCITKKSCEPSSLSARARLSSSTTTKIEGPTPTVMNHCIEDGQVPCCSKSINNQRQSGGGTTAATTMDNYNTAFITTKAIDDYDLEYAIMLSKLGQEDFDFDDEFGRAMKPSGSCYTYGELKKDILAKDEIHKYDHSVEVHKLCKPSMIIGNMKCVVCNHVPLPPARQCLEGDLFCHGCSPKDGKRCPKLLNASLGKYCNKPIQSRNLFYNRIFRASMFSCGYASLGCPEKFLGSTMEAHLEVCEYRKSIRCPVSHCETIRFAPKYLYDHMIEHACLIIHGKHAYFQVVHLKMNEYPVDNFDFLWVPAVFNCYGLDFYTVVQESHEELYFWVSLVSPQVFVGDRKFNAEITLKQPKAKGNGHLGWGSEVLPKEKDFAKIPRSESCYVVLKKKFEQEYLYQEKGVWVFNMDVRISEVKTPHYLLNY